MSRCSLLWAGHFPVEDIQDILPEAFGQQDKASIRVTHAGMITKTIGIIQASASLVATLCQLFLQERVGGKELLH